MMKRFTFHQVLGSRLKVLDATDSLAPSTYDLKPANSEGFAR